MEEEDDNVYLIVVMNDEDKETKEDILTDNLGTTKLEDVTGAQKHSQNGWQDVMVKVEPDDTYEELETDYIDYEFLEQAEREIKCENALADNNEYLENEETDNRGSSPESYDEYEDLTNKSDHKGLPLEDVKYLINIKRLTKSNKGPKKYLKRVRNKSLVEELRQRYEELRKDETKLVHTVEQIMRDVKAPDPPRDFFIINGIMFECIECGHIAGTHTAATRHYNEKHGPRYLLCYACGDDFRSSINLYKHELRCRARDAHVVLKARAGVVGSRGRGRPFLTRARALHYPGSDDVIMRADKYPCTLCSAVFTMKSNLQAHMNMHRGERPYRCASCPRAYTNQPALLRHSKTHTDEHFICDHCKRSFKSKPVLKSHLNTHEPVRKLACPECDRRYAQKSGLKLHIHRDHRKLPPPCPCEICPKRYPRMSLLKDHMQKEHGLTIVTREMFYKILPTMSEAEVKECPLITVEI